MATWHAEVTELVLRRYPGDDAHAAFAAGDPYDGTALVRINLGQSTVGPLLVSAPAIGRPDLRQIEAILRAHGAQRLEITRHGRLIVRE
jgi:hypothetical protein